MFLLAPASLWDREPTEPEENPSRKGWIAIAVTATLALGAAVALAVHRRGPLPGPEFRNYVGADGYLWPYHERFPNERAFGLALQNLGYDSGVNAGTFTILSPQAMSAVKGFQRDYNLVRQTKWEFIEPGTQSVGQPDGFLGDKTIEALLDAEAWIAASNLSWADLLDVAKSDLHLA